MASLTTSVGPDEERVLELIPDRRRIVFLNRRPRSRDVSYVVADNRKAATILVRHLVDRHHGRIRFVSGPSWAANARERLEGFFRAHHRFAGSTPSSQTETSRWRAA